MKKHFIYISFIILIAYLTQTSCIKETSCEKCLAGNKQPIANAGPDQLITLPTDSVSLDGSASSDPDGRISSYLWTKISGPASFAFTQANASITKVKALVKGVYSIELKVTDNGGLSARDTIQITVNDGAQVNRPPVANAGNDTTINLPENTARLDGSKSTDPDNNIIGYTWTKIAGPGNFTITNETIAQTQVINLQQGVYQFELKVTDAGGMFSKDTVVVIVNGAVTSTSCGDRPTINANLVEIGTLSEARNQLVSATVNNKILFAGGQNYGGYSSRVDIYDILTNTWSTAELTANNRMGMAVATVGNKVLFAGGMENDNGITTSRVDIYDGSTNSWSQAELSQPRGYLAASTVSNKVLFAGGGTWMPNLLGSDVVDIYDNATNSWTKTNLSQGRFSLSANTIGNKVYFAGGVKGPGMGAGISTRIDIYDASTNSWSTSEMLEGRSYMASAVFNENIFWAGGYKPGGLASNQVEIRNIQTGVTSVSCITARANFQAVKKGDNIIFFTGATTDPSLYGNQFEIYNTTTGKWSTGKLNQNVIYYTIISVNNTIYVAGGMAGDSFNPILINKVWKLEF